MPKLTKSKNVVSDTGSPLVYVKNSPFKIAICEQLDNNFCFKDLKNSDIKHLHKFIDETIGKNLTISKVDKLYLRTKGQIQQEISGREVIHYGKNNQPFRIFGYYNSDGYFNITRIDPKHKTHKS